MVSPDVGDTGSKHHFYPFAGGFKNKIIKKLENFVVYLSCIYIYIRLIVSSYQFFCIYFNNWYITCCPKWEEALEFLHRVIGEVLVLSLLVVVYKIAYSSCMWARQVCSHNTTVYLVQICAFHSPVYHYITATAVYLVQRIIAVWVVVIWSKSLYLSRMNSQRGCWVCWKPSNTRWKSGLICNTNFL